MSIYATKWAYDQDVTPAGAKFVLVALADFADAEGHCYPSQKRLAKMTGQSERSVRDHVLALEEDGYLRREKRTKADGTRATDEFFLNGPKDVFDPAAKSSGGEILQRQLSPKPAATLSKKDPQPAAKSAAYPSEGFNHQEEPSGITRAREETPMQTDTQRGGERDPESLGNFEVTTERKARALAFGVAEDRIVFETALWRDHYTGRGTVIANLDATWNGWMRRAGDNAKQRDHVKSQDPTRALLAAAPKQSNVMRFGIEYGVGHAGTD